jgi:signal peptidase I
MLLGCEPNPQKALERFEMTIVGSSMETTLHGRRLNYSCRQCDRTGSFTLDEAEPDDFCPWCGGEIAPQSSVEAQRVVAEPLGLVTELKRFDKIIIRDEETQRFEVKRLIGYPGEEVSLRDGDIWINGKRSQKTLDQFLDQAIVVEEWRELKMRHLSPLARSPIPADLSASETGAVGEGSEDSHFSFFNHNTRLTFDSSSLWPRVGAESKAHPAPILDEYRTCPAESRSLVPVRDIGLRMELEQLPKVPTKICVFIFVDEREVFVPLSFSENGWNVVGNNWQFRRWVVHVAFVDDRILVGDDRSMVLLGADQASKAPASPVPLPEVISPDALETDRSEQVLTPISPIAIRIDSGNLDVRRALILRDIHYRGAEGETYFELPTVPGYHLLGDNVSNSSDSRQRWPDGVSAEKIVGRIVDLANRFE